jgi:hypothetical protein
MTTPESDVVHEQPTKRWRSAADQIMHFWPLLIVVFGGLVVISSTLGRVYVSDIAKETYLEVRLADPIISQIRTDITTIKGQLTNLNGNDAEIRTSLSSIETRLDTLIRINLERAVAP